MSNRSKKECLRCGTSVVKLARHLQNKNKCDAKYLDIDDEMIKNYDKYYQEYKNKKEALFVYCSCGKKYNHQSSLSRHKKMCNSIKIEEQTVVEQTVEEQTVEEQTEVHLQHFGYEVMPNIDDVLLLLLEEEQGIIENIPFILFKVLHVDTIENRNICKNADNSGIVEIFEDSVFEKNCWTMEYYRHLIDDFPRLIAKQFYQILDLVEEHHKDKVDLIHNARIAIDDYYMRKTKKHIMRDFRVILEDNKEVLIETKKKSKKINKYVSSDITLDILHQKYLKKS